MDSIGEGFIKTTTNKLAECLTLKKKKRRKDLLVLMQVWWSFRRVVFCMPLCWSFTGASNRNVGFCKPLCWSFTGTSNTLTEAKPFA